MNVSECLLSSSEVLTNYRVNKQQGNGIAFFGKLAISKLGLDSLIFFSLIMTTSFTLDTRKPGTKGRLVDASYQVTGSCKHTVCTRLIRPRLAGAVGRVAKTSSIFKVLMDSPCYNTLLLLLLQLLLASTTKKKGSCEPCYTNCKSQNLHFFQFHFTFIFMRRLCLLDSSFSPPAHAGSDFVLSHGISSKCVLRLCKQMQTLVFKESRGVEAAATAAAGNCCTMT